MNKSKFLKSISVFMVTIAFLGIVSQAQVIVSQDMPGTEEQIKITIVEDTVIETPIKKEEEMKIDKAKEIAKEWDNLPEVTEKKQALAPVVAKAMPATQENVTKEKSYYAQISMNKEHQEYLYKLSKERNLDFKKMLAVIKVESTYQPGLVYEGNYGYFQVNQVNHLRVSKELGTKMSPIDPYVNINWGTFLFEELYNYWSGNGKTGSELDECVLSSYNKGVAGFKKYGKARNYINKYNKFLSEIKSFDK